jgi:outer membrane receptor protein involved in Fe transport
MKSNFTLLLFCLTSIPLFAQKQKVPIDSTNSQELQEVVVTATKQKEFLLQAPVSIEKLDLQTIQQSAQPSFFDAIQNLKGIQVLTPSLGFKVINARGFANTTNVRFVQMVDGVDIQAPHIGASIGNSMGANDLDILKVEIIPGSASAIYGMNAINGIANCMTKNPFDYHGISINQKSGFNNYNSPNSKSTYFSEINWRIAKAFHQKWAFKITGTFVKGTDWYADNPTDLNPNANTSTYLVGENNSGSDRVNVYGDEQGNRKTLTLAGKQYVVSRTGYTEQEVADYGLKNFKADLSLYYRPTDKTEILYTYKMADQNNIYQRTNRFRFDDYTTQQHVLNFKSNSIQIKTYLTTENTGNSYNIRSMAENIDRSFKNDNLWFADFTKQFNTSTTNGKMVTDALVDARNFADKGRLQPNTDAFKNKISDLSQINNWDVGAALKVKAKLYHAEFQHDLTATILKSFGEKYNLKLLFGFDYRDYNIVPDGNYFINPTNAGDDLNYWKTGGFAQATKLFFDKKLKINAVIRMEKNQYFTPKINPRVAVVYSPTPNHNFRVALQNGYRFPSIFEAFSNINSGGRKRIGGLPIMSSGIFENSYTQSSISLFQSAVQTDVNQSGLTLANAISKNKVLLEKNTYTYLQPEEVISLEAGYRTESRNKKLTIDADFYYNQYKNLMAQIDANVPKTNAFDVATNLQNASQQDKYRLWTNSKTISYNYGSSLGVGYELPQKYKISANVTYSKLDRKDQNDGLEDGFNTPEWAYNISLGNPKVYKSLGFNVSLRHQNSFLWQSALATGTVPSYTTIDAQGNVDVTKNLNCKLGATNSNNKYYYSYIGGSSIGGYYYASVTYAIN